MDCTKKSTGKETARARDTHTHTHKARAPIPQTYSCCGGAHFLRNEDIGAVSREAVRKKRKRPPAGPVWALANDAPNRFPAARAAKREDNNKIHTRAKNNNNNNNKKA